MSVARGPAGPVYLVPITSLLGALLMISVVLAGKIVSVGGVTFMAAVIVFPASYLFGDALTEVYGYASTRAVVWTRFLAQAPWILAYGIAAALPPAPSWPHQAAFEAVPTPSPSLWKAPSICRRCMRTRRVRCRPTGSMPQTDSPHGSASCIRPRGIEDRGASVAGSRAVTESGRDIGAHGARLTIDLGAIAANWRMLATRGADCAAVVKADAYGCGVARVGPALWAAGCRTFFVAHLSEAIAARAALPEAAIYILNGLPAGACAAFAAHDLRPVLGSREEILEWAAFSGGARPAALHVDTGMNRLGLPVPEALELADDSSIAAAGIDLLLSHFVSAEKPADPVNARQIADFARVRAAYPGLAASLANSSGVFLDGARHELLRPGYALFGGNPTPEATNPMRPVVRLEALITQVRHVDAGTSVGYNGRWTAPAPSRLATLSLGYADGFPRAISGRGQALVCGMPCPILGLVSMDLIILDVTAAPEPRRGDTAVLIGDSLDIDTVGRAAGTIGYEILTGLGSRYVRTYVG